MLFNLPHLGQHRVVEVGEVLIDMLGEWVEVSIEMLTY